MTTTIDFNGRVYPLDRIPDLPHLFAQLPRLRDAYQIDESHWTENDAFAAFDPRILNQIQNGCVGHGGCTAIELAFMQAGIDLPDGGLSPTFLYATINGGIDQGAMIGDLLKAWTNVGNAPAATFPESEYFERSPDYAKAKAEAADWQIDEGYAISTWEELGTALSEGFPVARSFQVGRNFMNIDKNGVVGVDRGPGNHCECDGGIRKFQGVWQPHTQNSWSKSFGINGRHYSTKDHVQSQQYFGTPAFSAVAIKSVKRKPGSVLPAVA